MIQIVIVCCFYITNLNAEFKVQPREAVQWKCMKEKENNCTAILGNPGYYFPTKRGNPYETQMYDRISSIGFKHLMEVQFLSDNWYLYDTENYYNPIECYLSCLKPYTTVWVDRQTPNALKFVSDILPLIKVPIILFMGDGDEDNPMYSFEENEKIFGGVVKHYYTTNCRPDIVDHLDLFPSYYECVPIGLSHLGEIGQQVSLNRALRRRIGDYGKHVTNKDLDNNKIMDEIRMEKDARNAAFLGFSVTNNAEVRNLVADYFCGAHDESMWDKMELQGTPILHPSPFREKGGIVDCTLIHVGFHTKLATYRFVVSPHGGGWDCYRTWEILFMGSYPIVKTSQIDILYKDLPVLIVKEWSDITPELMNRTYHEFMSKTWNFDQLYLSYWEQKIYKKRAEFGAPVERYHYYLT